MGSSRIRFLEPKSVITYLDSLNLPKNPAIVFDVDGTLLDANQQLIRRIAEVYWKALSLKITPFIVTARPFSEDNMRFTTDTLQSHKIDNFAGIYMLHHFPTDLFVFKENCRKNIHERGYNIVMSIGDSMCDIGPYGGAELLV